MEECRGEGELSTSGLTCPLVAAAEEKGLREVEWRAKSHELASVYLGVVKNEEEWEREFLLAHSLRYVYVPILRETS